MPLTTPKTRKVNCSFQFYLNIDEILHETELINHYRINQVQI